MHRLRALAVAPSILAFACVGGDDVGESAGESAGELQVAEFEDECAMLFSCGCEYVGFADPAACAGVFAVEWAGIEASAVAAGLTPDLACYKATRPYATLGCASASEAAAASDSEACTYCQHGHGEKGVGEPCKAYDEGLSDCAQGLLCPPLKDAACLDPCAGAGAGEPCVWQGCAEGLFCDHFLEICLAPGAEGEPCVASEGGPECQEGLACHYDDSICIKRAGLGEDCSMVDCEVGLYCPEGPDRLCGEPAAAGESCDMRPCAPGLACDLQTLLCGPLPGLGEPCFGNCQEGLFCWGEPPDPETCMALPGDGEPCPVGMCAADLVCAFETETCGPEPALVCVDLG